MATCLSTSKLSKRFGGLAAVDALDLEVEVGEVMGLLGPNGAGKTTTLQMLTGLVLPTSGTVSIFGKELRGGFLEIAPRVGVMLERPAFFEPLSVRRNLKLFSRLAQKEVNVDRILDMAGLLEYSGRRVHRLSAGVRQRVALALALLTEPELLILDEPGTGLDVESTQEMLALLRLLAQESKVTILFSSHQLDEVELLCDRVAIINQGRLVACERTGDVLTYDLSHVDVLMEGCEGAAKRLSGQEWVQKVELHGGKLRVDLEGGSVHQLTAFLVNAGYQVNGVIPRRRSLQEYFLKVTNS
jgi:ABC-type multidrug transport system ATPase subunit